MKKLLAFSVLLFTLSAFGNIYTGTFTGNGSGLTNLQYASFANPPISDFIDVTNANSGLYFIPYLTNSVGNQTNIFSHLGVTNIPPSAIVSNGTFFANGTLATNSGSTTGAFLTETGPNQKYSNDAGSMTNLNGGQLTGTVLNTKNGYLLSVAGNGAATNGFVLIDTNNTGASFPSVYLYTTTGNGGELDLGNYDGSAVTTLISGAYGVSSYFNAGGAAYVGIGTNAPDSLLHVAGNGHFNGTVTANSFTGNGSGLTNNTAMAALGPNSMPGSNTVAAMIVALSSGSSVSLGSFYDASPSSFSSFNLPAGRGWIAKVGSLQAADRRADFLFPKPGWITNLAVLATGYSIQSSTNISLVWETNGVYTSGMLVILQGTGVSNCQTNSGTQSLWWPGGTNTISLVITNSAAGAILTGGYLNIHADILMP